MSAFLTALPSIVSIGTSIFGSKGPSRQQMLNDLKPFRQGLDSQLERINEYRDQDSSFWSQQQDSLINQAYNSADFSNMLGGRMNFGAASGIQNQQAVDRTTQNIQGVGGLMTDAWLNLQKHTDQMYQDYLAGENNYSQALTGIRSAQHAQQQDYLQNIIGASEGLMTNVGGKTVWQHMTPESWWGGGSSGDK